MKEQLISFETAKLAKEKGFDNLESLTCFYTKPNSKMFGIDKEGRSYPIKNTSKKLYKCGEHAALRIESIIEAPTQSLLQKWLRDEHEIHIQIQVLGQFVNGENKFYCQVIEFGENKWISKFVSSKLKYSYEEALEKGLQEALVESKLNSDVIMDLNEEDEAEREARMRVIGQNGNTGEHYE